MQIQATDSTIGFILEPAEASALLRRIEGEPWSFQSESVEEAMTELHDKLSDFIDGPVEP